MAWTRLDDRFIGHPKVVPLTHVAFRLYVSALNWSVAHLTDGHLPAHVLAVLLPFDSGRVRSKAAVDLVGAGLWALNDVGWVIHDFTDYQETKDQVTARREKWAAKKRRGSPAGIPPGNPPEPTLEPPPVPSRTRSQPIPNEEPDGSSQRQKPRIPANVGDGLWTVLDELFGLVTESHRSRRGKIVKGLRGLGATPEQVRARHAAWDKLFPNKITITDTALEKFWGNLGLLVEAQTEKVRPDCDICRNRWQVGVTNEGFTVEWDDEYAVGWKPCRCVKGATK